jgi:hypothetical protein
MYFILQDRGVPDRDGRPKRFWGIQLLFFILPKMWPKASQSGNRLKQQNAATSRRKGGMFGTMEAASE